MSGVQWADSALRDLTDIRTRLTIDRPDDVQQAIDRIILSTDLLLRNPGIGTPTGYRRWRKWRAERTPYLIFYQPDRHGLAVVGVLHERSDWWSVVS